MDKFIIAGGNKLTGKVKISGGKNAALAIIPATILSDGVCRIENVPSIDDVSLMARILNQMGANVKMINKSTLEIDASHISSPVASYELVKHMRASCYLLGALLGKFSKAVVALPGGDDFGVRPIDQHLKGFMALGAEYKVDNGMVHVKSNKLHGNTIYLDVVSVGATINIILAAVKTEGLTIIENAAKEPHIVDLANFLNSMGADIRGAGTDVIKIRYASHLRGTTYSIIPDQIEAGTFMVAAAATGGDVKVTNVTPKHLESITAKLEEMGIEITEYDNSVRINAKTNKLNKCNIKTMPYPGFPTDMQPQITTLLSIANGTSIINENVWDNRFRYVEELNRMGSKISVEGKIAVVEGIASLMGAPVKANDLRAGAAMVIAGLAAKGITTIEGIHHIERGYENIVQKLLSLGADIKKVRISEKNTAKAL